MLILIWILIWYVTKLENFLILNLNQDQLGKETLRKQIDVHNDYLAKLNSKVERFTKSRDCLFAQLSDEETTVNIILKNAGVTHDQLMKFLINVK